MFWCLRAPDVPVRRAAPTTLGLGTYLSTDTRGEPTLLTRGRTGLEGQIKYVKVRPRLFWHISSFKVDLLVGKGAPLQVNTNTCPTVHRVPFFPRVFWGRGSPDRMLPDSTDTPDLSWLSTVDPCVRVHWETPSLQSSPSSAEGSSLCGVWCLHWSRHVPHTLSGPPPRSDPTHPSSSYVSSGPPRPYPTRHGV